MRGVIVTVRCSPAAAAAAGAGDNVDINDDDDDDGVGGKCYDFASRYFAPWAGINEDPVCGQCVI